MSLIKLDINVSCKLPPISLIRDFSNVSKISVNHTDDIPYGSTLRLSFEQFENSQIYEGLKMKGLNDRISRKPQFPCSSKASNGIQ